MRDVEIPPLWRKIFEDAFEDHLMYGGTLTTPPETVYRVMEEAWLLGLPAGKSAMLVYFAVTVLQID